MGVPRPSTSNDALTEFLGKQVGTLMPLLTTRQACGLVIKILAGFQTVFGSRTTLVLLYELTEAVGRTPVLADEKESPLNLMPRQPGEH